MSIIDSLFNTPAVKKAAFGMLRKAMAEGGYKSGVFHVDDTGEIQAEFCKTEQLVINEADYKEYRRVYGLYVSGELIEIEKGGGNE